MTTASKPATAPSRPAHGLAAPDKFYAAIRPLFGKITTPQFEGMQATMAVGRAIQEGTKWNKDAVQERAANIEAFVRAEWGD